MGVDVFGRRTEKPEATRGPPGIGYKLTQEGQYDTENKRICNLASPIDKADAVNLITLQQAISDQQKTILDQQRAFEVKISESLDALKTEVEKILAKNSKNQKKSKKNEESSGR